MFTYYYCYVCSLLGIVFHRCSVYCLCVTVYCTTATGYQPKCSYQIYRYRYMTLREPSLKFEQLQCGEFLWNVHSDIILPLWDNKLWGPHWRCVWYLGCPHWRYLATQLSSLKVCLAPRLPSLKLSTSTVLTEGVFSISAVLTEDI